MFSQLINDHIEQFLRTVFSLSLILLQHLDLVLNPLPLANQVELAVEVVVLPHEDLGFICGVFHI